MRNLLDVESHKERRPYMNDLFLALRTCDLALLKREIDAGADVNQANDSGWTVLMSATKFGSVEAIKLLVDAGADVHADDERGRTALWFATASPEKTKLLIASGIDVNHRSKAYAVYDAGETALMIACGGEYGSGINRASACALCDAGADVNAADARGETALMRAAAAGCYDTVSLLIERGAKVNMQSERGETALSIAAQKGAFDVMTALIQAGADVHWVDKEGCTLLMHAALGGNLKAVKFFIDLGADLHAVALPDTTARSAYPTALHCAAYKGHADCLKLLIEAGADVHRVIENSRWGTTALICAARGDHPDCIKVLLNAGADPNVPNDDGETPLILNLSVYKHGLDCIKALIQGGADVDAVSEKGNVLSYCENDEDRTLLLEAGAINRPCAVRKKADRYFVKAGQSYDGGQHQYWSVCFDQETGLYTGQVEYSGWGRGWAQTFYAIEKEIYDGVDQTDDPCHWIQGRELYEIFTVSNDEVHIVKDKNYRQMLAWTYVPPER